jgi:hypothetical protein
MRLIAILTLTSDTMTQGQMYDAASTIVAQEAVASGVGQVSVAAARSCSAPSQSGVAQQIRHRARTCVRSRIMNANRPKWICRGGRRRHWQIYANDQAKTAAEYMPLIVAYRNGNAVQLTDVAEVVDSVQDLRNAGMANGKPSVLVIINRQPNANIIDTVDRVTALLPELRASIPSAITLTPAMERTATIRASLRDVGRSLGIDRPVILVVRFPARRARDVDQRGRACPRWARSASCKYAAFDQQFHADGADDRRRLCRRRRDRRSRSARHVERMAPFRPPACARQSIHGAVEVFRRPSPRPSDPADGRHRRAVVSASSRSRCRQRSSSRWSFR